MPEFSFPKTSRLLKRREFLHLLNKGQTFYGKYVIIQWRKTGQSQVGQTHVRLGVIITKKFGKAVVRNRFKRLVREAFRLCFPKPFLSLDFSVRPRQNFELLTLSAILSDFAKFFASFLPSK